MIKSATAVLGTVLMLASQPVHAAARVAVAHFAPFADSLDGTQATTSLYLHTGGSATEDTELDTQKIGEIDFEILGCNDATATVRLDGEDPQMYTARQLTRPFPCVE